MSEVFDEQRNQAYLSLLLDPVRVCAAYKPRMGQGLEVEMDLQAFQQLYGTDPFYSWFGLDI